ncbi:hypothetical protein VFPPC_09604 [Pochonia chlamydosporia 170]|uniref:Uncharacterized protein n=1 Tax=Pochonia chlamydosporia 170 TaxID=1380566 RepID=A0A179F965_METCM|nr:hypothetical protein VFPPC_09604 [Pochonia chlamydosporia 170]OAQ61821.1 hypothetical protein VFPPC_09604 [Pochonia chlamydosporia 170]
MDDFSCSDLCWLDAHLFLLSCMGSFRSSIRLLEALVRDLVMGSQWSDEGVDAGQGS